MTPEELDAIEARLNAATSWPWFQSPLPGTPIQSVDTADDVIAFVQVGRSHEVVSDNAINDAAFIAHAPDDVARLVAEVRRLTRELAEERSARSLSGPHATMLKLLQPETPMEQANAEPARPVQPGRWTTGWENPQGLVWWFLRDSDGVRRARSFPLLDGTFGWDIPAVPGETYAQGLAGESGFASLQDAQRAAEEWLANNGGGA